MTETPHSDRTRPTDEIEPMVPRMPRTAYTDGGTRPTAPTPERPPATDHAQPEDRHREEIEPLVPLLE